MGIDDSNIIGNSLTDVERSSIEERLHNSGINVPLYMGVMALHRDPTSPFKGKLKFGLRDEIGIIDAKAAKKTLTIFGLN